MRIAVVFGIGILVGAGMQTTVAQTSRPTVRLNHIGLSVKDLGAATASQSCAWSAYERSDGGDYRSLSRARIRGVS